MLSESIEPLVKLRLLSLLLSRALLSMVSYLCSVQHDLWSNVDVGCSWVDWRKSTEFAVSCSQIEQVMIVCSLSLM